MERRAQVRGRVQRLGGHAPAQSRAQHGYAGGLAEGGRRLRQDPQRTGRAGRDARVLARGDGLVGGDGERGASRDAAVGGFSQNPARSPESLNRPAPSAAGAGRVLQRDVRLPDPHRTRRRPQDGHGAAPRTAGVQARKPGAASGPREREWCSSQSAAPHHPGTTAPAERQARPDRSAVMSEASNPIRIKPEQAIAEAAALGQKIANAADLGQKIANGAKLFEEIRAEDVAIATTPKDEVWRQDKVTLSRYRPV